MGRIVLLHLQCLLLHFLRQRDLLVGCELLDDRLEIDGAFLDLHIQVVVTYLFLARTGPLLRLHHFEFKYYSI